MGEANNRAPEDDTLSQASDDCGSSSSICSDASCDELGVVHDATPPAPLPGSSFLMATPTVESLSMGPASGRSSFSSYKSVASTLTDVSDSDSEIAAHSRCTSLSPSICPPEVEEIGRMPPWCASPVSSGASLIPAVGRSIFTIPTWKSQWQMLREILSKRNQLVKLEKKLARASLAHNILYYDMYEIVHESRMCLLTANDFISSESKSGSIFIGIFGTGSFEVPSRHRALLSELNNNIEVQSWICDLLEPRENNDHNEDGPCLPPVDHSCCIWPQLAKVYHTSPANKLSEAKKLISLTFNNEDYKWHWYSKVLYPLIDILRFGDWLQLFNCEPTFAKRVAIYHGHRGFPYFGRILEGENVPLQIQATVLHAISELAAFDPKFEKSFAEVDFIWLLVKHFIRFNDCDMQIGQQEKEPFDMDAHILMKTTLARALWNFAKRSPSSARKIIRSKLLSCCLTKLLVLKDVPPESRSISVKILMEVANVFADEDACLRQFFKAVYSRDAKDICHKLRSIVDEGARDGDYSKIVPCIIGFTCLANAFKTRELSCTVDFYEGWEIVGTLIHILEMFYPGFVTKETAIILSENIPVRSLIHDPKIQAPEMVILCCISKYVAFEEPEYIVRIRTLLEWASEERYLTKDTTVNRLILEAKSEMDKS